MWTCFSYDVPWSVNGGGVNVSLPLWCLEGLLLLSPLGGGLLSPFNRDPPNWPLWCFVSVLSLVGGSVVPWSVGPWVKGAQLPLASNTVFSGHVFVDGGGATPEGGGAVTWCPIYLFERYQCNSQTQLFQYWHDKSGIWYIKGHLVDPPSSI